MKGRIAFFGFTFFRSLLGFLFFTGLDSYAAVLAPQRSTIYNSGPRAGYVPGDLILKLKQEPVGGPGKLRPHRGAGS